MLTLNHIARAAAALGATGQHDLAADFWQAAIAASPGDPVLLTAAGVTYRAMKRPAEAEAVLRRAIAIEPSARRHVILGCSIHDQLRFEECEAEMRRACELDPSSADAAGLLGIWLLERWHWRDTSDDVLSEAIAHIERGIELAPDNVVFHSTHLAMLVAADRLDDVIAEANRLLGRWPNCIEFHLHRSSARMKLGQLVVGYGEFAEWAYQLPRIAGHPFNAHPQWNLFSPPTGPDVHVWNVEGAGDYFQFIRFAGVMAADGYTVRPICNKTMDRLVARVPGVEAVVGEDVEVPDDAVMAAIPALPAAYVGLAPLWSGPYMTADDETVLKWSARIAGTQFLTGRSALSYRVGLAWRGNPKQANDERRSFDFERLAPVVDLPGVTFVSLQKGHRIGRGWNVVDLGDEYEAGDWLDTAGVIANLDLVITPDTAIAHLAGAMGKPVWIAISEPCCWRWMQDRTDSPWYPSARLFRQRVRGSWDGVFERMASDLLGHLRRLEGEGLNVA